MLPAVAVLLLLGPASLEAPASSGHLLVRFADAPAREEAADRLAGMGLVPDRGFRADRVPGLARLREGPGALEALRSREDVLYAEPDPPVVPAEVRPDDPRFPDQFNLENTGQGGGSPGADVGAPAGWESGRCTPAQVIGIVDVGMDLDHPDLAPRTWTNPGEVPGNGIDDEGNGYVDDVHGWNASNHTGDPHTTSNGHGTAVGGVAAAAGDNATGISGVCWNARMMALAHSGPDVLPTAASLIELIDYALAQKERGTDVVVLNMSLLVTRFSQALEDALAAADAGGILVAAAAGNSNLHLETMPLQPASSDLPNVLTVAATDRFDARADFSNFGRFTVEVAAPGKEVWTTILNSGYGKCSGTSCATPHVAAGLALLRERFPAATHRQLAARIRHAAEPLASLEGLSGNAARLHLPRLLAGSVSLAGTSLDDADPARGNGDGFLDPGETGILTVEVDNLSAAAVGPVELVLRPRSAGVRLVDGYARLESLPPASRAVAPLPFSFALDGARACTGAVSFDVEIRTAGEAAAWDAVALPVGHDAVSVLLDDRFETDQGWTSSSGATDGPWERGDPVGAFDSFGLRSQPEDDLGADPDTGAYVTENGPRNGGPDLADVDGGSVFLRSPSFGEAGSRSLGVTWSRWFWSDSTGADDVYELTVSADGGATWKRVARLDDTSLQLGTWFTHFNNLGAALGGASPASLALRVEVRDGALDAATVEGALDEVSVRSVREVCAAFTPVPRQPPHPVGDTLQVLKETGHLRLEWQAPPADATHDPPLEYAVRTAASAAGPFQDAAFSTDTVHVEVDGLADPAPVTFYRIEAR